MIEIARKFNIGLSNLVLSPLFCPFSNPFGNLDLSSRTKKKQGGSQSSMAQSVARNEVIANGLGLIASERRSPEIELSILFSPLSVLKNED